MDSASAHAVRSPKRLCLVSAAGGHLCQIQKIKALLPSSDTYFVVAKNRYLDLGHATDRIYFIERILRNPIRFLVNSFQSLKIFMTERPDVVISTGSGEAVPTFIIARCLGRKTVFVESFSRVRSLSATGKLLRYFANEFLVQWEPLLRLCPEARLIGPLFEQATPQPIQLPIRVLVTVGTQTRGFERLIRTMDAVAGSSHERLQILAQIGTSEYLPTNMQWFRFLSPDAFAKQVSWADVIVTHSGAGLIGQALELGKRVIVVPRMRPKGESLWAHDEDLPRELSRLGVVKLASDGELGGLLAGIQSWVPSGLETGWAREVIRRLLLTA